MVYLALSCLQGRPMRAAAEALLALEPDGLQLTPGNAPSPGFMGWLASTGVPVRAHHGFHPGALRRAVWSAEGNCLVAADSVHPPREADDGAAERWLDRAAAGGAGGAALETMYPGYALGTGRALERAMALGVRLAVDVAHLAIQRTLGVLSDATWGRLREYTRVDEVHVSESAGARDAHRGLLPDSFGLGWARERLAAGTPVVFECYLHRLAPAERRGQLELLRGRR